MSEMLPKSDNPGVWHREIFDSIHDAVFVHDPVTGRIESMNRRAEAMWGIRREEVGMPTIGEISANVPPYTQVEAFAWIRRTMEEGPQLFEWQARHAEGRVFWVEVNLCRADVGGRATVLATVRDITRRKKAEEELRRGQHYAESQEYRAYREGITRERDLWCSWSESFELSRIKARMCRCTCGRTGMCRTGSLCK